MKLNKPKFWDNKFNAISFLLYPFSLIVILTIFLKKKFTKKIKFDVPVICVGNIYIGGTGKTPTSIFLANELLKFNKNPVILRKFYKAHKDEHNLIKHNFKNFIISENRIDGIFQAKHMKFDSIILDDGFQDCAIEKDLSIICFNQKQLIGNGLVLPAGPLRESLNSLKKVDVILINGKKDINFEKKILNINKNLKIYYSKFKPVNIDQFRNSKLLAIAGIGNPNNFFQLLLENGLNIEKKLIYPDHYQFTKTEILNIIQEADKNNYQIIMTEKDYFKIKDFNFDKIKYLKVLLEIEKKDDLLKKISNLYDQNN